MKKAKKEIKEDQEVTTPKFSITERLKVRFKPKTSYVINMELNNGMHVTFVTTTKKQSFRYLKKDYIIDDDLKYYNVSFKNYALNYHQSLALPVKQKIPLNTIKKTLSSVNTEVETAVNPSTLKSFIESEVIEKVMRGQEIDAFFKRIMVLLIITMIAGLITLFLFVKSSGMLENLNLPI